MPAGGLPIAAVFTRGGEAFTDSRTVAAVFGKRHDNVVRDIRHLVSQGVLGFEETTYVEPQNVQSYASFNMTRDGFTLLAMGFTGKAALRWKLLYIEAFNEMEKTLRTAPAPAINVRDPGQLSAIAAQLIEVNRELEGRAVHAERMVEVAAPKVAFYDRFVDAEGLYTLQNAGRVLGQGPNKFVSWLKLEYLFYQGAALMPYVKYKPLGIFEVKSTLVEDKARSQTYITPKGIKYFADKLGVRPPVAMIQSELPGVGHAA